MVLAGAHGLATASRDRTLRLWPYVADGAALGGDPTVFIGHEHYVTALAYAPPGALAGADAAERGALVSGGRDATVIVWDVRTAVPLARLSGHSQQVRLPLRALVARRFAARVAACHTLALHVARAVTLSR